MTLCMSLVYNILAMLHFYILQGKHVPPLIGVHLVVNCDVILTVDAQCVNVRNQVCHGVLVYIIANEIYSRFNDL